MAPDGSGDRREYCGYLTEQRDPEVTVSRYVGPPKLQPQPRLLVVQDRVLILPQTRKLNPQIVPNELFILKTYLNCSHWQAQDKIRNEQ